jgi:hypothetical protein
MNKIKWALICTAILIGVGGTIASQSKAECENQTQYFKWGNSYIPAGQYGVHYTCQSSVGVCTFVLSNPGDPNSFVPCRTGSFTWIY